MILVVTERLNLAFLLQHQGRVIHSAGTVREALEVLRTNAKSIQGVILDERVPNSRLVAGYIRNKIPNMQLVSWQVAQRNSPFKNVAGQAAPPLPERAPAAQDDDARFIWYAKRKEGELHKG